MEFASKHDGSCNSLYEEITEELALLGKLQHREEVLPSIGDLTKLIELDLQYNYLFGEIPMEIGKLHKLWQLELYNNELTRKHPVGL
ncbi:hypothetical protein F3Y22_tig00110813pilonHSYRG00287 [Hibiscus syriacus]|uniref:Uncharacterized protein n=1 Tax=Hibiscus syriacus TaxID=106335 RepID=A0A6A2ZPM8_HIBSY|nr:hypothetical protein F3Y22_tig00110813pilonHSYRG00287 [Hibiscus syriacus]